MIIDIHTHIFNEESHKSYFGKTGDQTGKALVLHFWKHSGGNGEEVDFKMADLLNFIEAKENLYLIGSVNIEENIDSQLGYLEELFKKNKLFGIKLYLGYQHFYPADERVFPIAKLCEKYNKPLVFHTGDFYDPAGKAILKYSRPLFVDELAVKFPECKIVIAHFGFPYLLETANIVSKNKNVFTDISGTIDDTSSQKEAGELFNQYKNDLQRVFAYFPDVKLKTMFGTDYGGEDSPLNRVEPYIELVKEIFSKEEQENVFHKLAEKIFFE